MQWCFRIAKDYGRPLEEVEEMPFDEIARYIAFYDLEAKWQEEAQKKAQAEAKRKRG